jgi:class 3 adenylate cyclase
VDERALERKIVSVLFCDLEGFTTLSEGLDAEDVVTVQDAYFAAVEDTVGRYGGRLEKYIGDAAVAVFGVPRLRDDDAERAVRAGLALATAVDHLNARLGLDETVLRLRVGVNTGEVVQTEGGPERGPVTGDTVNVAARLQGEARPGGVLVGETTALAVEGSIELEPAGALELKGKAEPVRAWHAVAARPEAAREHAMGALRAPILGREQELVRLREELESSRATPRRVVLVAPPGVGKTRLVNEFASSQQTAALARARLRPDLLAPYESVGQLLLSALGTSARDQAAALLRDRLSSAGAAAARAQAVVEETLSVVWPDPSGSSRDRDLGAEREGRFAAWVEALDALAAGEPSLWIVEDVHWAGGDLLAFLDFAGRQRTRAGRLVLATSRPSLLESAPEWCLAEATIHLPPLSPTSAADLVRALVEDSLPAELVARIAERSDGNPLFIEELLRTWISVGTLQETENGWQLTDDASSVALPPTVQAIYGAQLDDLPPNARAAARRASVAGRRFPLAALDLLGVPEAEESVSVLERRALVTGPHPDVLAGPSYAYRHALLRDAGYASLARAERALLHVRLAAWLEMAAGERRGQAAELIARHYTAAVESAPALGKEVAPGLDRTEAARLAAHWFELGAEAALELAAHETARSLLGRSLELTAADAVLDEARRRLRLGEIAATSADMDEGAAELARARELFAGVLQDGADETRERARAGYARATASLGWIYNEQVAFDRAERLAAETLAEIGDVEDPDTGRLILLRAVSILYGTDELERPLQDVRRALAIAEAAGDRELELDSLVTLTRYEVDAGQAGPEKLRSVERLSRERGRWASAASTMRTEAMLLLETQPREAEAALHRAVELCRARGLQEELAWADYSRAELGLATGDWDAAVTAGLRAIELAERNAYRRPLIRTWYVLMPIAAARGDAALLRRAFEFSLEFRPSFPAVPAPWARVMSTAADLRFLAHGWKRTAAYEVDEEACLPAFDDWGGVPSWHAAAEEVVGSWLKAGAHERARRALDLALAGSARAGRPSELWLAVERLLRARLLLAEAGPAEEIVQAAREAADRLRPLPARWWSAKAIRLLDQLGEAPRELVAEAEAIEHSLKLPGPAL